MRWAVVIALVGVLCASATAAKAPIVPRGQLLVSDRDGRLLVIDGSAHIRRKLPFTRTGCCPGQAELSADRRHAFVSVSFNERFALLEVDLAAGRAIRIAAGGSPVVSLDGRRLAYFAVRTSGDIPYRTAVVIRDLVTGRSHAIPFAQPSVWGTPPDVVMNWSPDGRRLALIGWNRHYGGRLYVVDVAHAPTIESQPNLGHLTAPVFLDDRTVLALANCCIGTQQKMVALPIRSGAQTPFATLPEPPESLRRIAPGTFVATTPDGYLLRFLKGRVARLGTAKYFSVSG
jgi:hypothetical protein